MSFASMHNDYLDPDRHLWQDYDDSEEAPVTEGLQSIRDMVAGYDNPYRLYRAVYKGTDCGPSIGMRFDNGPWVYGDNLPDDSEEIGHITHIGASSIVEGSDVEIEFREAKSEDEFWKNLEEINEEASFYWKRDNTTNLKITCEGEEDVFASYTQFDDEPIPDASKNLKLVRKAFKAHWDNKKTFTFKGKTWAIEEWIDDSTF